MQNTARVFPVEHSSRSFLERRQLFFPRSSELDVANLDDNIGYAVDDGFNRTVGFGGALVLHVSRDRVLHQHRLQHIGDLFRQPARKWKLPIEQRSVLLDAAQQFLIAEPDKIFEAYRNELIGIDRKSTRLNSSHLVISY